jgi:raffinose/stachyose/melibiose transport system substrate-binding protein
VANVGEIIDAVGITDKFIPFALDYERFDDGSLWLLPFEANVEYFYYHKDLFQQAGVDAPKTIDEFLSTCTAIGKAGITPISVAGKEGWPLYRYLSMPSWRQMGNEFLDKLKVGEIKMNSEVGIEDATFFQQLGANCFQEGFTSTDYTAALDLFMTKKAAIYYVGTWELHSLLDESGKLKDDIAYFKMPVIDANDATGPSDFYAHSGIGTAIRADAATDELKEFLAFAADRFAEISHKQYGGLSSFKMANTDDLTAAYKDVFADMAAVKQYAKVWDVKLDAGTVDTLLRQSQLLGLGQATPEQFATEVDTSIQQYLSSR